MLTILRDVTSGPTNAVLYELLIAARTDEKLKATLQDELGDYAEKILDGLVKGHANKVIARTCDITEATVKVHMKSILRKIRVTNRTQAAIWALENGSTEAALNGVSSLGHD